MASNMKLVVQEDMEPPYEFPERRPKTIKNTRTIDNILYVGGRGPEKCDVMFVSPAAEEEETMESYTSLMGVTHREKGEFLKGPVGTMFKDVALQAGIDMEENFYTAVCKWLLPRAQRAKPPKKATQWGEPALLDEIKRVDPKVVVCLGKVPYDLLNSGKKRSAKNAHGCWNYSEKIGKLVYLMDPAYILIPKPDKVESMRTDLKEVKRKILELEGKTVDNLEVKTTVIENSEQLQDWVDSFVTGERQFMQVNCPLRQRDFGIMSVDSEWHGSNHTINHLRSVQIAWNKEEAIYIRLMDDDLNYVFDVDYREVGFILSEICNRPENMYIAHHWQADSVQLYHHLGLDVIGRCFLDTEFAQQTVDENSDLSLTRLSMKYTTFGRYEHDLIEWKIHNSALCKDGYGYIPDDIMIPYACLAWDSQVQLGDGSWERIHKLVQRKYEGTVMAEKGGVIQPCKVTNWKKTKKIHQDWYRVVTPVSVKSGVNYTGPRFTPDHEIMTQYGMVRVDQLEVGKHRVITSSYTPNTEVQQVILGSLMGDGGLTRRNGVGISLRFSQSAPRIAYAEWKAESLRSLVGVSTSSYRTYADDRKNSVSFDTGCHDHFSNLINELGLTVNSKGHVRITKILLDQLDALAIAVWVMDDGSHIQSTLRLNRRPLTEEEADLCVGFFQERYGKYVRWDRNSGIVFSSGSYWRLMDSIRPYMHPSVGYKHPEPELLETYTVSTTVGSLVELPIVAVVDATRKGGNKKMEDFRYCLTVPDAGNFVTKLGVVSNCRDVLAPMRALEPIMRQLRLQNLWDYYVTIHNPFVADVFTEFTLHGLPMDKRQMEDLRRVFNYAHGRLMIKFRQDMCKHSEEELLRNMEEMVEGLEDQTVESARELYHEVMNSDDRSESQNKLKQFGGPTNTPKINACWEQIEGAPIFNINSSKHMKRWLFDVCGYEPIKSTNQKADGRPSMAWDAVLELPPARRKLYTPATDKQTLEILAEKNPLLAELLDMKAVANLCKAFLKEADVKQWVDEQGKEEEEVVEAGLFRWISPNSGRIHGMNSCTDTARPRSWNPNTLNWPGFVNGRITKALVGLLIKEHHEGILPEDIRDRWLRFDENGDIAKNKWGDPDVPLPSIRSCVKADEGMMFVESDYQTAEVRG